MDTGGVGQGDTRWQVGQHVFVARGQGLHQSQVRQLAEAGEPGPVTDIRRHDHLDAALGGVLVDVPHHEVDSGWAAGGLLNVVDPVGIRQADRHHGRITTAIVGGPPAASLRRPAS